VRRHTDATILRLGAATIVIMLLVMAASFNLQKFPGFGGDTYQAYFTDASGLHKGNMVQVAGVRVGRVEDIKIVGAKVLVDFQVDNGVQFGTQTGAQIDVLNLLGEKYIQLNPAGPGQLATNDIIPLDRTDSSYDIVQVFGGLTKITENINTARLGKALETVATTVNKANPQIKGTFDGLARLSETISSRDAGLQSLLHRSAAVSHLLAARKGDLTTLIRQGNLLFTELSRRHQAIHRLLVNTGSLATQLRGLVIDNRAQIGPALHDVRAVLGVLQKKDKRLKAALTALGPYVSILGNIIGNGPWFDGYVVNLLGIGSGEFQPGTRQVG
jgi:phospholipid/cholesterol/gamma-HCH transport system substrate-binding protein